MAISLIAALGKNHVIGNENSLIWKIPNDMKRFREITNGKPVIMGRKTFESIGRPLPNRTNIIITNDKNYKARGCIVVHSLNDALEASKSADEIMVIGGAQIYSQFLPLADKMYLTIIDADFEGDAYFPKFDEKEWKIVGKEDHSDNYNYSFVDFERVRKKD